MYPTPFIKPHRSIRLNAMRIILSLALLAFTQWSLAESTEPSERWYQIEIIVFANNLVDSNQQEQWDDAVTVNYPENLVHLTDPVSEFSDLALTDAVSTELAADNISLEPLPIDQSDVAGTNPDELPLEPTINPYQKLPTEQQLLNQVAKKLTRRGEYRILFHQAWLQPLTDRQRAPAIVVTGGEAFDKHYELEGTVSVAVERYLHIDTNLWLNSFISNAGLEPSPWAVLPAVPVDESLTQQDEFSINTQLTPSPLGEFSALPFSLFEESAYQVERTVPLRQQRRMRSEELHYIDHPLMGLLIKIIPYEPMLEEPIEGGVTAPTLPAVSP
jgi:hypothetical protein